MKQNWKRSAAALGLTLTMILPIAEAVSIIPCLGVPPVPIGTVVDHVLYTDITAEIDGQLVPTYCITGKTVVAAEDLLDYGFDVVWDNGSRTLEISLNTDGKEITADYNVEENTHPIGTVAGDVLSTDIAVRITDWLGLTYEIPSWNIGTKTVVDMNDLAKAFGRGYYWSPETRHVSFNLRNRTVWMAWEQELTAPEQTNELGEGFAVSGRVGADKTIQFEGEGGWGAVDNLKISDTGVSFSVYQRVTDQSALAGLTGEVVTYDPIRDNIPENRQVNTAERQKKLDKYFCVCVGGYKQSGELWLSYGNGHTDYEFRFERPLRLLDDDYSNDKITIAVGTPLWVADHIIPDDWTEDRVWPGHCEIYRSELAHIYNCSMGVLHGGNTALYVIWPDGTKREYTSELPALGYYFMNTSYHPKNITISEDGASFTFECPVYELHDPDDNPFSPNYILEDTGTGIWLVDLVTGELTLESIAD